jgi:NAD+ synthase (glutamine-hydrolysing)
MKVALAQINATVGDLAGNARASCSRAREAHARAPALVVAPELA